MTTYFRRTPVKSDSGAFCRSAGGVRGATYLPAYYDCIVVDGDYAYVGGRTNNTGISDDYWYPIIHKWHLPTMTLSACYKGTDANYRYSRLYCIASGDLWAWRFSGSVWTRGRIDKINTDTMTETINDLIGVDTELPFHYGDYIQTFSVTLDPIYKFDNDAEDIDDVTEISNAITEKVAEHEIKAVFDTLFSYPYTTWNLTLTVLSQRVSATSETEYAWRIRYLYKTNEQPNIDWPQIKCRSFLISCQTIEFSSDGTPDYATSFSQVWGTGGSPSLIGTINKGPKEYVNNYGGGTSTWIGTGAIIAPPYPTAIYESEGFILDSGNGFSQGIYEVTDNEFDTKYFLAETNMTRRLAEVDGVQWVAGMNYWSFGSIVKAYYITRSSSYNSAHDTEIALRDKGWPTAYEAGENGIAQYTDIATWTFEGTTYILVTGYGKWSGEKRVHGFIHIFDPALVSVVGDIKDATKAVIYRKR
jgi:hypothetical protein